MSLQDVDDLGGAANEIDRVLTPGGHACVAVVHPLNSGGLFEERRPDAPFVIRDSYLETRRYADDVERDGLRMTFSSYHRPLQDYVGALTPAGCSSSRSARSRTTPTHRATAGNASRSSSTSAR